MSLLWLTNCVMASDPRSPRLGPGKGAALSSWVPPAPCQPSTAGGLGEGGGDEAGHGGGLCGPARATLTARRGFIELKGEGSWGSLLHLQPGPLKWRGGRLGRGRGAPRDRGWKHSQKSCPVVGMGMGMGGGSSLLAPFWAGGPGRLRAPHAPAPGRGKSGGLGGSVPLLPQGPREPDRCPADPSAPRREPCGGVTGAGKGDPRPLSPGVLRLSAGATAPPPAGDGRSCPSSASPPRGRSSRTGRSAGTGSPWTHGSAPGPSSPIPLPSPAAFVPPRPPTLPAPPGTRHQPWAPALGSAQRWAIFIHRFSIRRRGKPPVPTLLAADSSGSPCRCSS